MPVKTKTMLPENILSMIELPEIQINLPFLLKNNIDSINIFNNLVKALFLKNKNTSYILKFNDTKNFNFYLDKTLKLRGNLSLVYLFNLNIPYDELEKAVKCTTDSSSSQGKQYQIGFYCKNNKKSSDTIVNKFKKIRFITNENPYILLINEKTSSELDSDLHKLLDEEKIDWRHQAYSPCINSSKIKLDPYVSGPCPLISHLNVASDGIISFCPCARSVSPDSFLYLGDIKNDNLSDLFKKEFMFNLQRFLIMTLGPLRLTALLFSFHGSKLSQYLSNEEYMTARFIYEQIKQELEKPIWPTIYIDKSLSDRMKRVKCRKKTVEKIGICSICDICKLVNNRRLEELLWEVCDYSNLCASLKLHTTSSSQKFIRDNQSSQLALLKCKN